MGTPFFQMEPDIEIEDAPEEEEPTEKKGKKWDFHSKSAYLTYADVHEVYDNAKQMAEDLHKEFPDDIKKLIIGFEQYKDQKGGIRWHAHVYLEFHHKKRTRNCRFFDLWWLHPHIESPKKKNEVIAYCSKSAHLGWPYYNDMRLDLSTFAGFEKKQADYYSWQAHLAEIQLKPFTPPIELFSKTFNISFSHKRRHFWVYGPPNSGKTTRAGADHFDALGISYFEPGVPAPNGGSYGTFDTYKQQQLIIMEDTRISDAATIQALTDYNGSRPKAGLIRGRGKDPVFSKKMVIVITSNHAPGGQVNQDWENEPWFKARFNVLEIRLMRDRGYVHDIR